MANGKGCDRSYLSISRGMSNEKMALTFQLQWYYLYLACDLSFPSGILQWKFCLVLVSNLKRRLLIQPPLEANILHNRNDLSQLVSNTDKSLRQMNQTVLPQITSLQ